MDRNWSFLNDADLAELRDLPHRLRLTAPTNSNAKILNVRCSCMSQVVRPSSRFTGYDTLGQVHSLPEAIALWKDHLNALDDSG